MLSRDHVKLFLLMALTVACMGTLFVSQSIAMRNPSMRVLTAGGGNTRKFCMEPRKAARECEKRANTDASDSSKRKENCITYRLVVQKCENAVKKAYGDINMGGCPKQIKLLTLCEDEWCHHQDPTSCQKECAGVRENVSVCVQQRIMQYFKWNGLKENGTTA